MANPDSGQLESRTPGDVSFAPLGHFGSEAGKPIDIAGFTCRKWKPLVLGLLAGLTLGWFAYQYLGPYYQADTRIMVSQKSALPTDDRSPNFSGERAEHVHLIMSDAIVRRAVTDHGLSEIDAFSGTYDAAYDIIDSLKVTRSAGNDESLVNLIDISYIHADEATSRTVVEAIVAAYEAYLLDTQQENSEELLNTLMRRQEELELEIAELETAYYAFRDASPFYLSTPPTVSLDGNMIPGRNPYQMRVEQVRASQSLNRARQSETQSRISTLEQLRENGESREALEFFVMHWMTTGTGDSTGQGGGSSSALLTEAPGKAELDARLLESELLLTRLLANLGDDHPNVQKLRTQIVMIEEMYRQKGLTPPQFDEELALSAETDTSALPGGIDLVAAYMHILEKELLHLVDMEVRLASELEEAESEAKEAALFEVEDQKQKDAIARQKQQWQAVVAELESFGSRAEQEGYRLQQIADVRVQKSLKRAIKIVGACGVLGIVAVFGMVYFLEWRDNTVQTSTELRELLSTTVLGEVPRFSPAMSREMKATGMDSGLCYYHRPGSREAESFRTIRTSLLLLADGEDSPVVQVSSPEPGDGKTVAAANLALALAQSGKKTLLIDADLRRPRVNSLFGLRQEIGLSETLLGEVQWVNVVRDTVIDGLNVMTSGACPENPSELLSAAMLSNLLDDARHQYDAIIIDSPPLLAVSDPSVIAGAVDGLALVARIQKTRRPVLQKAHEVIRTVGVRLLGVIANDVTADNEQGGTAEYSEYYQRSSERSASAAKIETPPPTVRQPG